MARANFVHIAAQCLHRSGTIALLLRASLARLARIWSRGNAAMHQWLVENALNWCV
jgi:hypothetical protein